MTLNAAQGIRVLEAARWAGDAPKDWGLEARAAGEPLVEPLLFANRLCLTSLRVADRMVDALSDDVGAPPLDWRPTQEEQNRYWKYGLLGGLLSELRNAGALSAEGRR